MKWPARQDSADGGYEKQRTTGEDTDRDRPTELQRAGPVAIDSSRRLSISAGYVAPGKGAEFLNREAHDAWAREERTTPRDNLAKAHVCSDCTAVRECTTCWGFSDGWVGVSFPTPFAFVRSGSARRPEAEDVDLHAASASQKSSRAGPPHAVRLLSDLWSRTGYNPLCLAAACVAPCHCTAVLGHSAAGSSGLRLHIRAMHIHRGRYKNRIYSLRGGGLPNS